MTTVGWSALGSLILKVSSQSATLLEALSFTNVAIAVCTVVTVIVLLAGPGRREEARAPAYARGTNDDTAENLRALEGQLRTAENLARLRVIRADFKIAERIS